MPAALTQADGIRDAASEAEIVAILRGEPCRPCNPSSFAYAAVRHQVAPLLVQMGATKLLPPREAARLLDETRKQIVIAAARDRELRSVIEGLHADEVEGLLFKGAHLAATCYAEPHLRPRDDTDMLVRQSDRDRVSAALSRLGYTRQAAQTGEAVLGQMMFDRAGAAGAAVDVHLRVARPRLAASLFDFDDLMSRAVPLPRVSPHALGPSPADALALACVHQAAHHADRDMLLWTYDVHLLLAGFTCDDREAFVRLANERRMAAVCRAAIEPAVTAFGGSAGAAILERLYAGEDEPSAALLRPQGRLAELGMDVRLLTRWSDRARLIAGHLVPPAAYMRETYAPASRAALTRLYVRRLVRGVTRSIGSRLR
jgi:hypothetical protein